MQKAAEADKNAKSSRGKCGLQGKGTSTPETPLVASHNDAKKREEKSEKSVAHSSNGVTVCDEDVPQAKHSSSFLRALTKTKKHVHKLTQGEAPAAACAS